MDLGHPRHGFVTGLASLSGVKRTTLSSWFSDSRPKVPQLESLQPVADVLGVSRVEIVAALDGVRLMTVDQARRLADDEVERQLVAARAEGLPPAPSTRQTGSPRGTASRR